MIIGSTAPSLFDIKPTPLSRMHPGVEILATAIDNFKHDDYLRFPDARIAYLLLTLAIVWATAWGFYRNVGQDKFDRLFGASQFILLAISYASINFTTTYINLTGPVTLGLAYFTLARLYAFATGKALEKSAVRASQERGGELHGVLMLIRLGVPAGVLSEGAREKIRRQLEKTRQRNAERGNPQGPAKRHLGPVRGHPGNFLAAPGGRRGQPAAHRPRYQRDRAGHRTSLAEARCNCG